MIGILYSWSCDFVPERFTVWFDKNLMICGHGCRTSSMKPKRGEKRWEIPPLVVVDRHWFAMTTRGLWTLLRLGIMNCIGVVSLWLDPQSKQPVMQALFMTFRLLFWTAHLFVKAADSSHDSSHEILSTTDSGGFRGRLWRLEEEKVHEEIKDTKLAEKEVEDRARAEPMAEPWETRPETRPERAPLSHSKKNHPFLCRCYIIY